MYVRTTVFIDRYTVLNFRAWLVLKRWFGLFLIIQYGPYVPPNMPFNKEQVSEMSIVFWAATCTMTQEAEACIPDENTQQKHDGN